MKDGAQYEQALEHCLCSREVAMTDAQIIAKFRALCAGILDERRIDAAVDALLPIERSPDFAAVAAVVGSAR